MDLELWDEKDRELLRKYMDHKAYHKLTEPPAEETRASDKLCEEAVRDCKNPKLNLYLALKQAEKRSSTGNKLNVAHKAADLNDYVTALYWHEMTYVDRLDLDGQFERKFFKICAERQKRENPNAQPLRSSSQMSNHQTKLSQMLRSSYYPKLEYAVRLKEQEIYQNNIDKFESDLKLAKKKIDRADNLGCFGWLLTLVAALALLIYTVPSIWMWFKNFFLEHLFPLLIFFWVVHLLYIILVVVLAYKLSFKVMDSGKEAKGEEFKEQLKRREKELQEILQATDEYKKLSSIDPGLPKEFQSYGKRLALAELSELEGEEDVGQLIKLWKKGGNYHRWIRDLIGDGETKKNAVCRMLNNPSDTSDILLAVELVGVSHRFSYWTGEQIKYRRRVPSEESSCMLREMIFTAFSMGSYGKSYEHEKAGNIASRFCEDFLMEQYRKAKSSYDNALLGEVCYYLYYLYNNCHLDGAKDKCYSFGKEGIKYSDKLKYEVMSSAAYNGLNKEKRLGYTRQDVINYIEELKRKGDPLAKEFQATVDHAIKMDEERRSSNQAFAEAQQRQLTSQRGSEYQTSSSDSTRNAVERADMDSPFTILDLPDVITGPYQVTYRKTGVYSYGADYYSDHGEAVTIHLSDIGASGRSAHNSAGYFYW